MVYLPGGTFRMGDGQGTGGENERPVHEVALDPFAIGRFPVTVGEYLRFAEATNSHHPEWLEEGSKYHIETGEDDFYGKRGLSREAVDLPIAGISWEDAAAYCEWLSAQTGERYELLTEAQWEYACRAGSDAAYCFGDDEGLLGDYAWYSANAGGKMHPVGQKQANRFGLHDMHGNVWEWVHDRYSGDYYKQSPVKSPTGPESGSRRVFRGGSWSYDYLGFRLSRRV
jgi:formylglycine-generating enzyme required for sulfatase activity